MWQGSGVILLTDATPEVEQVIVETTMQAIEGGPAPSCAHAGVLSPGFVQVE